MWSACPSIWEVPQVLQLVIKKKLASSEKKNIQNRQAQQTDKFNLERLVIC